MTESPRHGGADPTQQFGAYPAYADPAYASQTYGPTYQPPVPAPTERLPVPPYGYDPYQNPYPGQYQGWYGESPPGDDQQPPGPRVPRWLWLVAGLALLLVVGLVIALVITNSSRQETVFAPAPSATEPRLPAPPPSTTPRPTVLPPVPAPSTAPTDPATPLPPTTPTGPTQTVVYSVEGTGRALNIIYVDTGGLLQTEFNVQLPWSKTVELPTSSLTASLSVINVGREVTCSVTVDGQVVQQRTGSGLTVCVSPR